MLRAALGYEEATVGMPQEILADAVDFVAEYEHYGTGRGWGKVLQGDGAARKLKGKDEGAPAAKLPNGVYGPGKVTPREDFFGSDGCLADERRGWTGRDAA